MLDHVLNLIHATIESAIPLTVPASVVRACPTVLRALLEPFMDRYDDSAFLGPPITGGARARLLAQVQHCISAQ